MDLMTVAEVAELFDLTTERIRQLAAEGKLPAIQTPYGALFKPTDVIKLWRERRPARAIG